MISKRAQLGSTLTWMVAFTIIFFVMLLFLLGVGTLAVGGKAFNAEIKYDVAFEADSLMSQRKLIVLLNSEVDFLGEEMSFKEAIIKSMDIYTKDEVFSKLNIDGLYQLRHVTTESKKRAIDSYFSDDDEKREAWSLSINRENAVKNILKEELNDECYAYLFEFPLFDVVYYKGKNMGETYSYFRDITLDSDLVKSSIIFSEGGRDFEVKLYTGRHVAGDCDEE
ncbi:hypothetical protein KAR91_16435 [Candidatus Pacearchaeota archaeon]|nr:hypothetical protein [Candidatus Pacearchaeota archaeon]